MHATNYPVAGLVLVRLNCQGELEILLDHRSSRMSNGDTWAFIGGHADTPCEDSVQTAIREAKEEYGICPTTVHYLGLQYKHDHGGIKYLTYTYVFAHFTPPDGQVPKPISYESVEARWFTLNNLPATVHPFLKEDIPFLTHILHSQVLPMLQQRTGTMPQHQNVAPAAQPCQGQGNQAAQTCQGQGNQAAQPCHGQGQGTVSYPTLPEPPASPSQDSQGTDGSGNSTHYIWREPDCNDDDTRGIPQMPGFPRPPKRSADEDEQAYRKRIMRMATPAAKSSSSQRAAKREEADVDEGDFVTTAADYDRPRTAMPNMHRYHPPRSAPSPAAPAQQVPPVRVDQQQGGHSLFAGSNGRPIGAEGLRFDERPRKSMAPKTQIPSGRRQAPGPSPLGSQVWSAGGSPPVPGQDGPWSSAWSFDNASAKRCG